MMTHWFKVPDVSFQAPELPARVAGVGLKATKSPVRLSDVGLQATEPPVRMAEQSVIGPTEKIGDCFCALYGKALEYFYKHRK